LTKIIRMEHSTTPTNVASNSVDSSNKPIPLHIQFKEALAQYDKIEEGEAGTGTEELKQVISAIVTFQRLDMAVRQASLFSSNETLEDFDTSALKYLLIPYYLGQLTMRKPDLRERVSNLNRALAFFNNFLMQLEKHRMLTSEDRNAFHREAPLPAAQKRTEKIARAKEEQQVRKQIQEILKRKGNSSEEAEEAQSGVDEETERTFWLARIRHAVLKALDEIDSINQELPLAQHMAEKGQIPEPQGERPKPKKEETKLVPVGEGTALPSTRLHQEQVKQTMFRPHWIQPTYTVEEAAEIEMKFMAKPSPKKEKNKNKNKNKNKEESDESESEEENLDDENLLRKKREEDEYKDDHPTGWGNRINQG
jgi:immunoglobulin-binding protein 1